jgi:hypothetical protein
MRDSMRSERITAGRLLLATCALVAFSVAGCVLPDYGAFLKASAAPLAGSVTVTSSQITLQWDPPPEAVSTYRVYSRTHGGSQWTLLGEAPAASQPEYTIQQTTVGKGEFDFAVVAVDLGGVSSEFHTSLDATADPTSGWYVVWK